MPVAKPGPATKKTSAATAPARTAAPAPRKTTKSAVPVKAAVKAAAAKSPARKTSAAKTPRPVSAAPAAEVKPPKIKLVRDSFTIPRAEYEALGALKDRLVKLARPAKKSELLRAGIAVLTTLNDAALLAALDAVPAIKTGRPKKTK
ncbi:MAG: hypothetical protein RBR52_00125 [Thiomonas sp.]|uniref:hypothetical protein n=1 Tax=Thiomonas sp. TaxID=2047785 RepID=UPI002A35CF7E|nr:hypothetical protein [Thiomonas sp.]MDY0328884.1 hypothetical protein [Thiomonas sp.]